MEFKPRLMQKVALDSFDNSYFSFLESKVRPFIKEKLEKEIGPSSITGETYRVINHWAEKGLIDYSRKKGGKSWRIFSLREILWLKIVQQLRSLDIGLTIIKAIKEDYWGIKPQDRERRLEEQEYYTAMSLKRHRVLLVASQAGECELVTPEELESYLNFGTFPRNYIAIDFGTIVRNHFTIPEKIPMPSSLSSISSQEAEVLFDIRTAEIEQTEKTIIRVKIENGNITHIGKKNLSPEIGEQISKVVRSKLPRNYFGTINAVIKNGSVEYTELEDSRVIKN